MNKIHPIIRWIIFIPASLIAGGVSYNILSLLHAIFPPGGLADYLNDLLASGLSGALLVYVGYYIAPNFKKRVLIGYIVGSLVVLVLTLIIVPMGEFSLMENLRYASNNIGIFATGWYLYKNED
jgi:hypothetical protein